MKARPRTLLTLLVVMLLILLFFAIELLLRPMAFFNSIASSLFSSHKTSKAADIWYHRLDENDTDPIPEANYGKSSFKQGNFAQAHKYFGQALNDDPENPIFQYDQGNSQYRLEKLDDALASYKKAMLADPHDQDAKSNYELVLNRQGYQMPQPEDDVPEEYEEDPDNKNEYENTLNALDQKEQSERQRQQPQGEDRSGRWW